MTEGLITRIGRWIDRTWQAKVTEGELRDVEQVIQERLNQLRVESRAAYMELRGKVNEQADSTKEIADLKTRIEKIELYSGMTRKVDPTKPAVVKSAFSM